MSSLAEPRLPTVGRFSFSESEREKIGARLIAWIATQSVLMTALSTTAVGAEAPDLSFALALGAGLAAPVLDGCAPYPTDLAARAAALRPEKALELRGDMTLFQAFLKFDEDSEVGDLGDLAVNDHARIEGVANRGQPGVLRQLPDSQADARLGLGDVQHHTLDDSSAGVLLVGMGDLLRPGDVGDVDHGV